MAFTSRGPCVSTFCSLLFIKPPTHCFPGSRKGVGLFKEDRFRVVAPARQLINCTRILETKLAGHAGSLAHPAGHVNAICGIQFVTPFVTRVQDRILHVPGRAALLRRPRIRAEQQLCPTGMAKSFVGRPCDTQFATPFRRLGSRHVAPHSKAGPSFPHSKLGARFVPLFGIDRGLTCGKCRTATVIDRRYTRNVRRRRDPCPSSRIMLFFCVPRIPKGALPRCRLEATLTGS